MFNTEIEKWGLVLPSGPYPVCKRKSSATPPNWDGECPGTMLPNTKPTPYSHGGIEKYIDIKHPTVYWKCNICGN